MYPALNTMKVWGSKVIHEKNIAINSVHLITTRIFFYKNNNVKCLRCKCSITLISKITVAELSAEAFTADLQLAGKANV